MAHHDHRHARLGAWVLINGTWYETVRTGAIGSVQIERRQWAADRPIRRGGFSLDPGPYEIVYHRLRVVPRILLGLQRISGRARHHSCVQAINRPRSLPKPPATRSGEAATPREAKKAME
jgi:hypothetical protein